MKIWDLTVKAVALPFGALSKIAELFFEKVFEPFWIYIAYKHFKVSMSVLGCICAWMAYKFITG